MRTTARAGIAGLAVAARLAIAAPAAQAWVKTATAAGDPQTTWIARPHSVTVRSTDPALLKFVRGTEALLNCGPRSARLFWGSSASSITWRTRRGIPRDVPSCEPAEIGQVPGFLAPSVRYVERAKLGDRSPEFGPG